MSTVIKVENVSKRYQLGTIGTKSLSGDLQRWWAKVRGREDPFLKIGQNGNHTGKQDFWALSDISFDVQQGDAIGIIGKNGAGKSTLLKILSRITAPTSGNVKIKGRIASLLEVGTGFNPELTGRENIFLNGAILGMGKAEVRRKFDEIVDFSGIEQFIDTPVKRYSSGMYVRLAFAVAAHLESEILILDEVLSVGDAEFQKKCLGKMDDVAHKQGRTILFVSHNVAAVENLCNRAILLKKGTKNIEGEVAEVISVYIRKDETSINKLITLANREDREGNQSIRFTSIQLLDQKGYEIASAVSGQYVKFKISCTNLLDFNAKHFRLDVGVDDSRGSRITWFSTDIVNRNWKEIPEEDSVIYLVIPRLPLAPGKFTLTLYLKINDEVADWIKDAFDFFVEAGDFYGTGRLIQQGQGAIMVEHSFELETLKLV